jgi:hypothetical protein
MGKFDKYRSKNFELKGIIGLAIFGVIILAIIIMLVKKILKIFSNDNDNNIKGTQEKNNHDGNSNKKKLESSELKKSDQNNTNNYTPTSNYLPKEIRKAMDKDNFPKSILKVIKELNKNKNN